MKKCKQLQLTLSNSKPEEELGNYYDKTRILFKTMRVRVIECIGFAHKGPVPEAV